MIWALMIFTLSTSPQGQTLMSAGTMGMDHYHSIAECESAEKILLNGLKKEAKPLIFTVCVPTRPFESIPSPP